MKLFVKILFASFLLLFCQYSLDAQANRKRGRASSSNSIQLGGNKKKLPAGKNLRTGPCGQAIDPVYYGVGLFNGSSLVVSLSSGSYTVDNDPITSIKIFGNFGWESTTGTNITYEDSGSAFPALDSGEVVTIHQGNTPKEAIAYFDDYQGSSGNKYPVYFGTGDQLNLGGGYAVKSMRIADGCRVLVSGKYYYTDVMSGLNTYAATLYHLRTLK